MCQSGTQSGEGVQSWIDFILMEIGMRLFRPSIFREE
jgi:hypothetical protein